MSADEPLLFDVDDGTTPRPRVVIEFDHLPSINDLLAVSRVKFGVSGLIKRWRDIAEAHAVALAHCNDIPTEDYLVWVSAGRDREGNRKQKAEHHERLREVYLTRPLAIELHCWRPDSRIFDVHNIFLKPILDGLHDARLFKTDSVDQIKDVAFVYDGIDKALAQTRAEREQRKAVIADLRRRGRKIKREPVRARYKLEFFELAD